MFEIFNNIFGFLVLILVVVDVISIVMVVGNNKVVTHETLMSMHVIVAVACVLSGHWLTALVLAAMAYREWIEAKINKKNKTEAEQN